MMRAGAYKKGKAKIMLEQVLLSKHVASTTIKTENSYLFHKPIGLNNLGLHVKLLIIIWERLQIIQILYLHFMQNKPQDLQIFKKLSYRKSWRSEIETRWDRNVKIRWNKTELDAIWRIKLPCKTWSKKVTTIIFSRWKLRCCFLQIC